MMRKRRALEHPRLQIAHVLFTLNSTTPYPNGVVVITPAVADRARI